MRAWLIPALLLAAVVSFAVPSSAEPSPCDGVLSCHVENSPPPCAGWYGSEDFFVGPVWITINYCKYWGPEP
jgi:hypothetical protein